MPDGTVPPTSQVQTGPSGLARLAVFPNMRVLAWNGNALYASQGYRLLQARVDLHSSVQWQYLARYRPVWWRNMSSSAHLSARLFRDGFHALSVLRTGEIVAAVPGAIITLGVGEKEFHVSHEVTRGTRPLHVTSTPDGRVSWGEYSRARL